MDFLLEYAAVEKAHGCILESTGELFSEFLARLTCRLQRMEELTEGEKAAVLAALRSKSLMPDLRSDRAQALILKACLELGRLRPRHRFITVHCSPIMTVEEIVESTIGVPLPKPATYDYSPIASPSIYSNLLKRARATPEYHVAVASENADRDYREAVQEVSRKYDSLDVAFREIETKSQLTQREEQFVTKYREYAAVIW
ncbi:MAG: hypothetical protein ABSF85_04940 [Terriglobales bacterium]|jgi:hypothetical protein